MNRTAFAVLAAFILLVPLASHAADTLVVAAGGGAFKPGVAKSWTAEGTKVTFVLVAGTDASQVAATLKDRLAQAKVTVEAGKIVVAGIPMAALLDQLSTLSLSGADADPLAALAGLGGSVQGPESPEAGGSIRASKPTPMGSLLGTADAEVDPAERFEADVLDVTRGAFPQVALKLKVRRLGAKAKLGYGQLLDVPVAMVTPLDLAQPATQRNVGAYYLKKGDRVVVHLRTPAGGKAEIDWIERK